MKRFGFTLAEVLITLGIIGVVAAITLPGVIMNTSDAQVGPKLGKAVSTFEQASLAYLNSLGADSLSEAGVGIDELLANLENFANISSCDGGYCSKDGFLYYKPAGQSSLPGSAPHKKCIGNIMIDINGAESPNKNAYDRFDFYLTDAGTLVPLGSKLARGYWDSAPIYEEKCPNGAIPKAAAYCTGSIFDNNMKVMYKLD